MTIKQQCSIVIITLNEERNIANLLDDLCRQSHKDFEVIVVDSASTDTTVETAQKFADRLDLKTIVMDGRGTSLGRNTGAENAHYERLLFLDADVRLQPDFLAKSLTLLEQKGLWVAGGRIGSSDKEFLMRLGIGIFDWAMWLTQFFFPTCTGACIFSTKTVHRTIGGFDLSIRLCEDCDYVNRAGKTFRFRMLPIHFEFNPRRLKQDGIFHLGGVYLRANIRRFFKGELRNDEIAYPFGHYKEKQ
ncbi:glycosyltransferase family 2 protein [Aggregatibacter kilianii]|uniref:glycosyltransferase family 2 protein n=2 Tax=Aggregatibacter TaxID=416916 RepID=UPI000D6994ED|nr:glycosyltransferase [Aggregatibacter kilianii]